MGRRTKYDTKLGITTDQDGVIQGSPELVLMGYSFHESSGAGGAVYETTIVDGATVAGGTEVAHIEGQANTSEHAWFGPDGLDMTDGISVSVEAGTLDCTIYYSEE